LAPASPGIGRQRSPPTRPRRRSEHLAIGARYAVVRAFTDFDGDVHPVGETWWFRGHSFLPHQGGLSVFGHGEGHIRLQWRPEQQGGIIDELQSYVHPAV
jgi:hypothetical protein